MIGMRAEGQSFPLGATCFPDGVNFSIFSKYARGVDLLLFDSADDGSPSLVIPLDPVRNRTYYYWHAFVPGIGHGQLYGYRTYGTYRPRRGFYFDDQKLLVDPYARAVAPSRTYSRAAASRPGPNLGQGIKSVVVDPSIYDWEGDQALNTPYASTVIYETHVRGLTKSAADVAPHRQGTYPGVIDRIPYLKSLGVTAVELLPVQHHDKQDAPAALSNYWGYSPVAFFAPHQGYSTQPAQPLSAIEEFRDMVKALHRAGIEVILDVVFNHTAEGDEEGPILSFKGLENRAYYILQDNRTAYADYSGTGNTINANHSVVRRLIIDCLHYWVSEMHVDGFRFDLASVMSRDEDGEPMENPPILWQIESDPVLSGVKIIAEAWDAAGLYQVGNFIGHRWAEWNGPFRDDVRRFVRGDPGMVEAVASRLIGSPDLYTQPDREPNRSINFITSHDGFTLHDLVSYNKKHNLANQEEERDGANTNFSWNCGVEGETSVAAIRSLRKRQARNLLTILFVSQSTPMILMGDECLRSQAGNNNAYCQDNATSWFDWGDPERHAGFLRFTRELIRLTQNLEVFRKEAFWQTSEGSPQRLVWHGVELNVPDRAYNSHTLAFELRAPQDGEHLHIILNAYWQPLTFELPSPNLEDNPTLAWRRVIDTAQASPDDIVRPEEAPVVSSDRLQVAPRSCIVLLAMPV